MTRLRFLCTLVLALAFGGADAAGQQKVDVTGKWAFAVVTENGTGTPSVILKQDGEQLSGTYESQRLGLRVIDGTMKGDTIRFTFKGTADGMPPLTFIGVLVDKDNMKGSLDMGGMGSATFTGKREH